MASPGPRGGLGPWSSASFATSPTKRIRRGVFTTVAALEGAINEYFAVHNAKPKPFIWIAKASDILAKVTRARAALNKSTSN